MSSFYLGKRLSFNDGLCTVRYHGPLPDQNGDWLGVEWDKPDAGKHNGQYKGKRLFETLSPSPSCASFIRSTRPADRPRTYLEALRYKYAEVGLEQRAEADRSIEISGKLVEEVGFERIRKQQALLQHLKIVVLDGLRIQHVDDEAERARFQDEVTAVCPNIGELDLSRNLFEHWNELALICLLLPKLRVLKTSGLRLIHFDMGVASSLQHVQELHLNDCLLRPDQVLTMLYHHPENGPIQLHFPVLTVLSLAGNHFRTFDAAAAVPGSFPLSTVRTLVLDNNGFTSLVPLCKSIIQFFPDISALSLQHNQISSFTESESPSKEPFPVFSSIASLNLSHNAITSAILISSLPQLFPNLHSLRVSGNPFFTHSTQTSASGTDEAAFMLTLARLPTLKTLNYSAITDKDRTEGELYYLSVAEKEISQLFSARARYPTSADLETIRQDWNRYDELCHKYERENVLEKMRRDALDANSTTSNPQTRDGREQYPPGSLGARLVTITFILSHHNSNKPPSSNATGSEKSDTLTLPRTLDVYRVKALLQRKVGREWGLKPLDFALELHSPDPAADDGHRRDSTSAGDVQSGSPPPGERESESEFESEWEEIPDSTRKIGDWIREGVRSCTVRVKTRELGFDRGQLAGQEILDWRRVMVL